jgi:hypothetical protein
MSLKIDTNQMDTEYISYADPHVLTIGTSGVRLSASTTTGVSSIEVDVSDASSPVPLFRQEYLDGYIGEDASLNSITIAGTVWEDSYTALVAGGTTYGQYVFGQEGGRFTPTCWDGFQRTYTRTLRLTVQTEEDTTISTHRTGFALHGSIGTPANPNLVYTDTKTPTVLPSGWQEYTFDFDMAALAGIKLGQIFVRQPNTASGFRITDLREV